MIKILVLSDVHRSDPAIRYRISYLLEGLEDDYDLEIRYFSFSNSKSHIVMGSSAHLYKVFIFIIQFFQFGFKLIGIPKKWDIVVVKNFVIPIGGKFWDGFVDSFFKYKCLIYDIDDGVYLNGSRKINAFFGRFRNARAKVNYWVKKATNLHVCNKIIDNDLNSYFGVDKKRITRLVSLPFKNQYFENIDDLVFLKDRRVINFVWLGSPHTEVYLGLYKELILKIINEFSNVRFYLIGTSNSFELFDDLPQIIKVKWSMENEKVYMRIAHFGLNPLLNSEFEKRKCAFKVFQYYRAGIIPIVSDVGINMALIKKYGGIVFDHYGDGIDNVINQLRIIIQRDLNAYLSELFVKSQELTLENNKNIYKKIFDKILSNEKDIGCFTSNL